MKKYLKATKLLNNIIIFASVVENSTEQEKESILSTLHTYYNDIAKMLYLDSINVTTLEEIEKLFKRLKKEVK